MLDGMTTSADPRLTNVLRAYTDTPLAAGDAVLLLDGRVCMEIAGLADHWDDVMRRNTADVLRSTARDVVLVIARPSAEPLPEDSRLWRELYEELRGSTVDLAPLEALPSA